MSNSGFIALVIFFDLLHISVSFSLVCSSFAQTDRISKLVREVFGSSSIEPNAMKELRRQSFQEEHFFESQSFIFHDFKGAEIHQDVVVVKDLMEYLDHVHDKRGLSIHETVIKIGLDSGGGSLKVCLSILPSSDSPSQQGTLEGNPNSVKALILLAVGMKL